MIKSRAAGVSARAVRAGMGGAGGGSLQGDVTEVWTGDRSSQGCLESHRELLPGSAGKKSTWSCGSKNHHLQPALSKEEGEETTITELLGWQAS